MSRIRPLAICVFRHRGRILVAEGHDPVKDEHFYRPLGGGIEFGEHSRETIRREVREEINMEIEDRLQYLGTVENIFIFNGMPGHEIVLIYDGAFKDIDVYERSCIEGKEANEEAIRAVWKHLDEFGQGRSILYPTGLLEILRESN